MENLDEGFRALTMLPISVEPRAQTKMMSLQPERLNSLAVELTVWRLSACRPRGVAKAREARRMGEKNFMLTGDFG